MVGSFLKNDGILNYYENWFIRSISNASSTGFSDIHIEEFLTELNGNFELPFIDICDFINSISSRSNNLKSYYSYISIVVNVSSIEDEEKWEELEVQFNGTEWFFRNLDMFTPPSIYLLNDIGDLVFEKMISVHMICENHGVNVFKKDTRTDNGSICTLNFVKKLVN